MADNKTTYDAIIVGAGPAGATAARELAKKGHDVLLIDKKEFPRDKTCGGFIPVKVLKELDFHLPELFIRNKVYQVSLYSHAFKASTYGKGDLLGITMPRAELDQFLVNKAIGQGARFMDKTSFYHLEQHGDDLKIFTSSGEYRCKILIGGDGVFSKVKTYVDKNDQISPYQTGFAVSTNVYRHRDDKNSDFKLFTIPVAFSMGWAIPMGEQVNIGVGGPLFKKRELVIAFQNHIRKIHEIYQLENREIKIKGAFLPAGGFRRKLANEKILLIGDAAGFVDPLTGEGIYYAVRSAKIAAEQICNQNLSAYEERCKREFYPRLRKSFMEAVLGCNKKYTNIKLLREKRCKNFVDMMREI